MSGTWHIGPAVDSLRENTPIEYAFPGKQIGLLLRDGQAFAFAARCPHAGAPLCDGKPDAKGHLVCPLHRYRFSPVNGYNSSGEGYKLKTFPARIEEGHIFVEF